MLLALTGYLVWEYWLWLLLGAGAMVAAWLLLRTETNRMPGPWGLPLVGYLPFLNPGQLHLELTRLSERYGPIFQLSLGQKRVVVLGNRAMVQEALDLPALNGRPDSGLTAILARGGHSSLNFRSADAPDWPENRAIATHATALLTASRCNRMEADVYRGLDALNAILRNHGPKPISSRQLIHPVVEAVAGALCFGRPPRLNDPLLKRISTDFDAILERQSRIELLTFLPSLAWFYQKDAQECLQRVRSLAASVRPHLGPRVPVSTPVSTAEAACPPPVANLSDALHLAATQLTRNGRVAEARMLQLDFFDAASHTISENLQWLVLLMATHPSVQRRVHRVLDVGVPMERRANLSDLQFLAYVEAVIWESLRYASNLPFAIPHAATTDVADFHGFRIPAGSLVLPNLFAINHDPDVFPEPFHFRPERLLLAKGGGLDRELVGKILPFSVGMRRCVGEKLGRAYLFLFFANLMRDWEVTLSAASAAADPLSPIASFSLFPKPHNLVFSPRRPPRSWHNSY